MQRDDPEQAYERPRHTTSTRLLALVLIVVGAFSLVTYAIHLVYRMVPVLAVVLVFALVVASRVKRKP